MNFYSKFLSFIFTVSFGYRRGEEKKWSGRFLYILMFIGPNVKLREEVVQSCGCNTLLLLLLLPPLLSITQENGLWERKAQLAMGNDGMTHTRWKLLQPTGKKKKKNSLFYGRGGIEYTRRVGLIREKERGFSLKDKNIWYFRYSPYVGATKILPNPIVNS